MAGAVPAGKIMRAGPLAGLTIGERKPEGGHSQTEAGQAVTANTNFVTCWGN